ncbi:MAG: leucine-rich repeat domain-containing protein [Lachnospiraceae bacterium]|nr:leucine-rich repeat domain-containing protein [Lachnospiraceae bacterium]
MWYIIKDESSNAGTEGTVTLLAAESKYGDCVFGGTGNDYNSSTVKSTLDALAAPGGSFENVAYAIKDTDYGKLYLLSEDEMGFYSSTNLSAIDSNWTNDAGWWLRTPLKYVGDKNIYSGTISTKKWLRPAVQIDCAKVVFDRDSKKFWLKAIVPTAATDLTYDGSEKTGVVGGTGYTLSGITTATNAGNYTATATLKDGYDITTVSDVVLPANWKWADADKDKALEVGKAVTATAVYNGSDKGNYETESVEIAITRKAKPETPVEQKPTVVEKGKEVTVEKKGTFEVTSDATSKTNTVTYTAVANTKAKSVTIPNTVTVDGKKCEVTEVSAEALKNSSATTVTIGKNVTTLAPEAFKGSNVKTITIKSKKLTKKSVKNAFKGLKVKKLIVKVKVGSKKENKKYINKYKKFFTKKNIGVKAVVK